MHGLGVTRDGRESKGDGRWQRYTLEGADRTIGATMKKTTKASTAIRANKRKAKRGAKHRRQRARAAGG